MGRPKQTPASFWARVDISTECWNWLGYCDYGGYGQTTWDKHSYRVHRVAAWLSRILTSLDSTDCVLHKCDNRKCCRPDHLFIGNPSINSKDMVKKGRQSKGKQVHLAKFDEEEVREIRRKYAEGISAVDLSRKYGVYRQTIGQIVRNKTWKHVN